MSKDEKRPGTTAATSLAEQLKAVKKEMRAARRRRSELRPVAPPPPQRQEPQPTDGEMFREATAGVEMLAAKTLRIAATPVSRSLDEHSVDAMRPDFTADEHFDVRFSDLYIRGRAAGVSRETVDRLARGEFAVRSHVDLHGMAFDDARSVVDQFLAERQKRGERCVLVITGKGKNSPGQVAVLRERIPEWLARGPSSRRVLAFVTARPCDGGEGALYVLLRKDVSRKIRIDVESGSGK